MRNYVEGSPDPGGGVVKGGIIRNQLGLHEGTDSVRKVRYHAVHTNRQSVPHVTGTVRCIDTHAEVLTVKCVDQATGCRVMSKTDVGGLIFHRACHWDSGNRPKSTM